MGACPHLGRGVGRAAPTTADPHAFTWNTRGFAPRRVRTRFAPSKPTSSPQPIAPRPPPAGIGRAHPNHGSRHPVGPRRYISAATSRKPRFQFGRLLPAGLFVPTPRPGGERVERIGEAAAAATNGGTHPFRPRPTPCSLRPLRKARPASAMQAATQPARGHPNPSNPRQIGAKERSETSAAPRCPLRRRGKSQGGGRPPGSGGVKPARSEGAKNSSPESFQTKGLRTHGASASEWLRDSVRPPNRFEIDAQGQDRCRRFSVNRPPSAAAWVARPNAPRAISAGGPLRQAWRRPLIGQSRCVG